MQPPSARIGMAHDHHEHAPDADAQAAFETFIAIVVGALVRGVRPPELFGLADTLAPELAAAMPPLAAQPIPTQQAAACRTLRGRQLARLRACAGATGAGARARGTHGAGRRTGRAARAGTGAGRRAAAQAQDARRLDPAWRRGPRMAASAGAAAGVGALRGGVGVVGGAAAGGRHRHTRRRSARPGFMNGTLPAFGSRGEALQPLARIAGATSQ